MYLRHNARIRILLFMKNNLRPLVNSLKADQFQTTFAPEQLVLQNTTTLARISQIEGHQLFSISLNLAEF